MLKALEESAKSSSDVSHSELWVKKYINSNAQIVISAYYNSFLGYLISLQRLNDNSEVLCKWKCPAHLISLVYSVYKT